MGKQTDDAGKDIRTNAEVVTQYRKLQEIKRGLIKEGVADGDATAAQVLQKLREQIPPNLL